MPLNFIEYQALNFRDINVLESRFNLLNVLWQARINKNDVFVERGMMKITRSKLMICM